MSCTIARKKGIRMSITQQGPAKITVLHPLFIRTIFPVFPPGKIKKRRRAWGAFIEKAPKKNWTELY